MQSQVPRIHIHPSFFKKPGRTGINNWFFYHITLSDIVRWYCISKHVSVKSLSLTKSPVLEGTFSFPSGFLQHIKKHEILKRQKKICHCRSHGCFSSQNKYSTSTVQFLIIFTDIS